MLTDKYTSDLHLTFYYLEIYDRALEAKLVQVDIEQLALLVLARAGYEKRKVETGDAGNSICFSRIFSL